MGRQYISEEPIPPAAAQMLERAMQRLGIRELGPEDVGRVEKRIKRRRFEKITKGRPVDDFIGFVCWKE